MTRGRHYNQACVVTERAGDEHTPHRQPPTAGEVLIGALRRLGAEKSATETILDELEQLRPEDQEQARAVIADGLRQAHEHSYQQTVRRQAQRQAILSPAPGPVPSATYRGPEL